MSVKAKYIKDLPLKEVLDGSESLLVQDLNGTQQASLGTIVDEIKQNSQEKIREIESEVVKKGYGTLDDFDEETRRVIQGMEQGQINAVLGTENVLDVNLALNSVDEFKMKNTGTLGNLFNKNHCDNKSGFLLDTSGNEHAMSGWFITHYIRVNSSDKISTWYYSGDIGKYSAYNRTHVYYDKNKKKISVVPNPSTNISTVPSNATYVRYCYQKGEDNSLMILNGDVFDNVYKENGFTLNNLKVGKDNLQKRSIGDKHIDALSEDVMSFIEKGVNLFNHTTYTVKPNTSFQNNGNEYETTAPNHRNLINEFIPFYDDTLTLSGFGYTVTYQYDEFMYPVSGSISQGGSPLTINRRENAKYFRVAGTFKNLEEAQIEIGSNATPYENYSISVKNFKHKPYEDSLKENKNSLKNVENAIENIQSKLDIYENIQSNLNSKNIIREIKDLYTKSENKIVPTLYSADKSSLENAVVYKTLIDGKINNIFKYSTTPQQSGDTWPIAMTTTVLNKKSFVVEFMADCSQLEVATYKNGVNLYLVVDDILMTDNINTKLDGDGLYSITQFDFGSHKTRHIKIYFRDGAMIYQFHVDSRGTIYPYVENRLNAVFDGDSITEGAGSDFANLFGYAGIVARRFNWDIVNCAYGGTGFVNPGVAGSGRVPIGERIDTQVVPHEPDVFVVCCGLNDSQEKYREQYLTAIPKYFEDVKEKLPNAEVIVISPFCPTNSPQTLNTLMEVHNLCKENALANGFPYIDIITGCTYDKNGEVLVSGIGGIITGGGTVGNPSPTGNRSLYMSDDGTHPVNAGHEYLGKRVSEEIIRLYKK